MLNQILSTILKRNIWRSVQRILMWVLGITGLTLCTSPESHSGEHSDKQDTVEGQILLFSQLVLESDPIKSQNSQTSSYRHLHFTRYIVAQDQKRMSLNNLLTSSSTNKSKYSTKHSHDKWKGEGTDLEPQLQLIIHRIVHQNDSLILW